MFADLPAFDHDLVECVKLDERIAENDDRREDPLTDVSNERNPFNDSRNCRSDVDSIQNEDPGEDEVLNGQAGVHEVEVEVVGLGVGEQDGEGDGEGDVVERRAAKNDAWKKN